MTNQEIAKRMRDGVARFWPSESRQCKGMWSVGEKMCFLEMLTRSLEAHRTQPSIQLACRAICQVAGLRPEPGEDPACYVIGLNEGIIKRPFAELVQLVHKAADLLDGGDGQMPSEEPMPAEEAPPMHTPPVEMPPAEMPPPNQPQPSEQPAPLPTSILAALDTTPFVEAPGPIAYKVAKEKEYA